MRILFYLLLAISISVNPALALSASSSPTELRSYVSRVEKIDNPSEEQLYRLACAKWWLHDNPGALKSVNQAIEINPRSSQYLQLRGLILKGLGSYAESLKDLNKAIEFGSIKPELYADRSFVKLMLKDLDGAQADADRCLSKKPSDATSWFVKGGVLMERKRPREAIEALTKAIETDPADVVALRVRALAYRQLGKMTEANADTARAHSVDGK